MAFVDEATAALYREAFDAWNKQIEHVHRVFLGDELPKPDALKGLLNREARAKAKYDAARLQLLGLDEEPGESTDPDANPFKYGIAHHHEAGGRVSLGRGDTCLWPIPCFAREPVSAFWRARAGPCAGVRGRAADQF